MNDDQFDKLLRDSDPAQTKPDAPLTMRQARMLEEIIATPAATPRRSWPSLVGVLAVPLAAVVTAIFVVVVVFHPFAAAPAAAFGPLPLTYQSSADTPKDVVAAAKEKLELSGRESQPRREARTTSWNLAINGDGHGATSLVIEPLISDLVWAEDLSGHLTVMAGQPYYASDPASSVAADESTAPGTVLDDRIFAAGEYPAIFENGAEMGAADFRQLMDLFAGETGLAGDAMQSIRVLLGEWTLTADQHAALLDALLTFDDVSVLGTTTDRDGREVVGLAGPAREGRETTVLISARTGHIVGVEKSLTQDDTDLQVPAGTVLEYAIWKDTE